MAMILIGLMTAFNVFFVFVKLLNFICSPGFSSELGGSFKDHEYLTDDLMTANDNVYIRKSLLGINVEEGEEDSIGFSWDSFIKCYSKGSQVRLQNSEFTAFPKTHVFAHINKSDFIGFVTDEALVLSGATQDIKCQTRIGHSKLDGDDYTECLKRVAT
mmetsp:Transcript_3759/g.4588  ORF Transcript_3759/g.4588 Transcript_3759/m.4588 type:complete len:159 (+) Transcript_3759:252-728(+)